MESTNNKRLQYAPLETGGSARNVGGIDSHQHFWKFDPVRDSWINDEMKVIQRDFLPQDLYPVLQANGFEGCVTVQSDQTEAENDFQLANADQNDFIKGVVGWVDLQAENIEERLSYYSGFKKLKGFRHVLQGEPQRDFMLRPTFMNGISLLKKYNLTYDILIFPDQLAFTKEFVAAFPDQKFVIDHIAKPYIKDKKIDEWKKDIAMVAQFENVFCKVSGMVTEADWKNWKKEEFTPYLDAVVEAFGIKRLMYGSDWPVCLVAAPYERMLGIVKDYFSSFSEEEQKLFFGGNAWQFYDL
ncbi:amidohydrolase family protein [Chitinophagaceae bacterium LB-8]|uniref:Amidohydrolase family protein n=1 Tax=Paraflavisolibacter caeni TaxID=2982496 RepID=A0A9X3BGV1_9BACT|nr:amidohydrolase family protein [Paraflavisolibacter caeni]MCU7548422.1 amidohydrolase family protein [Paraflavisolibacter caeni]